MMSSFGVFAASGEFLRGGLCQTVTLDLQREEGEILVVGEFDQSWYFDGTQPQPYTPEQWQARQSPPAWRAVWSVAEKRWVDQRTTDELREDRWDYLKARRAAALDAPLVTAFGTFDADAQSRQNITDAVLRARTLSAMGEPSETTFTLADNTVATLTAEQMTSVGLSLGSRVQAIYATSRVLREALDAANTAASIAAVDWPDA